jgi:hypothetical protein
MTDPVIIAAASLMLIPSLAPDIRVPPLHAFTVPEAIVAYATLCQTDYRIIRQAEATDMERADPHRLAGMRPVQPASHMTVRWRGSDHHRRHHRRHHR